MNLFLCACSFAKDWRKEPDRADLAAWLDQASTLNLKPWTLVHGEGGVELLGLSLARVPQEKEFNMFLIALLSANAKPTRQFLRASGTRDPSIDPEL